MDKIDSRILPISVMTCTGVLKNGERCNRPLTLQQRYFCWQHATHDPPNAPGRREQNRINVANFNARNPELRKARRKVYKLRGKFRTKAVPLCHVFMDAPEEALVYTPHKAWKVPLGLFGSMVDPAFFFARGEPVRFHGRLDVTVPETRFDGIEWFWAMVPFRGYVLCQLPESEEFLKDPTLPLPQTLDYYLLPGNDLS